MIRWSFVLLAMSALSPWFTADPPTKATAEQIEFFEKKVRPILADNCYSCHGAKKQSAALRLDTAANIRSGADNVPVIVPGDPAKSRLLRAVKREDVVGAPGSVAAMPPKTPISAEAVAILTEWIKSGAAALDDVAIAPTLDPRKHWAFQPIRLPAVPTITNPQLTINNPVDAFVGVKLLDKGLLPAPRADRRTLIRRAYFDLLGMPPSGAEVEAFEKDADPRAWEKLIDRLLTSPAYGERWGRYWLDLARYADTKGYVFNEDRNFPFAYTYRDYVIRAFNDDVPYDRFILEQLAADKLSLGEDKRPLAALGFLTLGRRFLGNPHDVIDDRIDVVTRGLMGLTVTCARCHDHKFDPIPTADYYSLYGVFASCSEPKDLPLIGEMKRTAEVTAFEKEVEKREAEYGAEIARRHAVHLKKLREPAITADYVRAVLESRSKPDGQLPAFVRERDLNHFAFSRWRAFLAGEYKNWSPVYGPIAVLADVPEDEFPDKLPAVLEHLDKVQKTPINPLIRKALIESKPRNLKEACLVVAKVLVTPAPTGPPTAAQTEVVRVWEAGGPLDVPVTDADKLQDRADRDFLAAMKKKIDAFKSSSPFAPPRAHVLNDLGGPVQPAIFLRGNPNNRGAAVPRQAPAVVAGAARKPFVEGSGRLELAKAITSPDNPLTARVMVNRVWAGHFGRGLVGTPSDFGTRSDQPTHPELLDWLAVRFVQEGWSIKKLHRIIMLSSTYQQSSQGPAEAFKLDPENKLLAHQNRRRLDFEALRDSLLAVTGRLDSTQGGKPVDLFKAPFSLRRSVYGLVDRTNFPGTMRAFDVASPDQHAPLRFQTTVAQQALFLMNSPFVTEQARALATRPEVTNAKTPGEKVQVLYKIALGRAPTQEESTLALAFTADDDPKSTFGRWPQLAQVLLLSNEFAFAD